MRAPVKPRHADDQGCPTTLHRLQNLRAGEGAGYDQRQPERQRRQRTNDQRINVMERQRQQYTIVFAHEVRVGDRPDLKQKVAIRSGTPFAVPVVPDV